MKHLLRIWEENKIFFVLYTILLVVGTVGTMFIELGDLVIWVNERHTPFLDGLFRFWTRLGEEPAFAIITIGFLFYRLRHAIMIPLLGIAVMLISFLLKTLFGHPRPSTYFIKKGIFEDLHQVELVHLSSGYASFPSGHTMAGFALFAYLAFTLKSDVLKVICLITAALIGFSRIYLMQHFLQDVCFGSMCGVIIAMAFATVQSIWKKGQLVPYDNPVFDLKKKSIYSGR